jgi:hypothetical protein
MIHQYKLYRENSRVKEHQKDRGVRHNQGESNHNPRVTKEQVRA